MSSRSRSEAVGESNASALREGSARVRFRVDGRELEACAGDSVASALLANGIRALRNGPDGAPRGLFCGIGICFDCLVTIDGRPGLRACMVRVQEQMDVKLRVR